MLVKMPIMAMRTAMIFPIVAAVFVADPYSILVASRALTTRPPSRGKAGIRLKRPIRRL